MVVNDRAREVRVYGNDEATPNPPKPRLWAESHCRRQKMNDNGCSP